MALSPTGEAKEQGDVPWTQEIEDHDNSFVSWFWECFGWKKSSHDTEGRLDRRLSYRCAGTSHSPSSSPGSSTKALFVNSSASSRVSCPSPAYHCYHTGCEEIRTVPGLIDWHCEKNHKGEGGYAANGQGEGPRNPSTASGLHVTNKPRVLSILSCNAGGIVEAFVESQEQGKTKQWPQSYSLGEFRKLIDSVVALEEFLREFS